MTEVQVHRHRLRVNLSLILLYGFWFYAVFTTVNAGYVIYLGVVLAFTALINEWWVLGKLVKLDLEKEQQRRK